MHRIKTVLLTSALTLAFLPSAAHSIEPYSCRNGFFPAEGKNTQLYRVSSQQPVHFFKDDKGCPDSAACKQKAYIVEGDNVLISKVDSSWACAWYQGKKRETVGWIEAEKIQPADDPLPATSDWLGTWTAPASSIKIERQTQEQLRVTGNATWGSGASTNVGEIDGTLLLQGRYAVTKDGEDAFACVVEFTRVGRFLIAHDNNNCGGMNVSFDGVYVRSQ
ncbi:hypothetical protein [Pseudomonas sp. GV071]|uniref:hypothetical protein n=1 Tax=Pseudomonas sp. GV071 TaxID=2135754 RepID=UPI000D3A9BD0|nr:hypothetical protein [Pseudomonas sp. GV071]PTQ74144.1 hypothetical protein C8K61_101584 [Pseudomonas sp. GV071]